MELFTFDVTLLLFLPLALTVQVPYRCRDLTLFPTLQGCKVCDTQELLSTDGLKISKGTGGIWLIRSTPRSTHDIFMTEGLTWGKKVKLPCSPRTWIQDSWGEATRQIDLMFCLTLSRSFLTIELPNNKIGFLSRW